MDVTSTTATYPCRTQTGQLGSQWIGEILGTWQPVEVRIARAFPECRGLATEQLEDLYQETVIALLSRPYASEVHLRNALRQGIRNRALNLHRDTRRRREILSQHASSMHQAAETAAASVSPESMALRKEDQTMILEFLGELDPFERQVFELTAEGVRYRAIAKRLGVDVNLARRAARSVERKRIEFRFHHQLAWRPHVQARNASLLTPVPVITAGVASARRWLFGGGVAAKAGATVATVAVVMAGALHGAARAHRAPSKRTRSGVLRPEPPSQRPGVARAARDRGLPPAPSRVLRVARVERVVGGLAAEASVSQPVAGGGVHLPGPASAEFGFESR